ncbi:MAM and LDL-receptor class A domain-containing protein 2-like [Octopus sinensis]|uniref:MAM and LDL-receptor class A domain-containing protein 2-like n=1 Tax=Octopus sinensis TaxID=2607531 RepID=A0A6P7S478_9MOLL|nr:MAM and LDL-receptor class A domain-containing protein 2-like [Octopus sinensis]
MMKMKTYPCLSRHTYLTLFVFAALTVFGHAHLNGDIAIENDGLVKVYTNDQWTAICVSGDFTVQSQVLCRSFGQQFSFYYSSSAYLPGTFRNLACRGDENSLSACTDFYFSSYGCSYSKLHVQCQNNSTKAFCPFDNDICGMIIEGTNYKWIRVSPQASSGLSAQSVPKSDHTTESYKGKYMLASATGFPGQKTTLRTKPFSGNLGSVSFYLHMSGRNMGSLNISVRTNNSSKKSIGSISGNQGTGWKHQCLPVNEGYGNHEIIFEAIQGNGFDSDIALDDVTLSENSCSSHWNVSCDFASGTCGYNIQNKEYVSSGWRLLITGKYNYSTSENYLLFSSGYNSEIRHSIKSPMIDIPNEKMKLEFLYNMPGTKAQELQVRFVEDALKPLFSKTPYFWQDSGDHGTEWQYGCMDLPSTRGRIVFTGIAENSYSTLGLDDLVIDKGNCRTGITNHKCTFDNPLLCEYEITCMNPNEYTWRRKKGSTPTSYTGPDGDNSQKRNGHYMYAEASYGNYNETTSLRFPVSKDAKGRQLKFDYHMYGSHVGQLYVVFITSQSSNEEIVWMMKGNKGEYWLKACVPIKNDISEIIFVAVKGYSYQGDIAIDNVVIEEKGCPGPFDCDFQNGICKYSIASYYGFGWYIRHDYSYESNTNNYLYIYSRTDTENSEVYIRSPQADVKENSSVTFKYLMRGPMKEFALFTYDSYSSKELLWSSNFNDIPEFITACVDFPNSTTFGLNFQGTVNANSYWDGYIYLDEIEVHNETCKLGLTYHFCKFKEVHLCNFQVKCPENTRYNWSQGSSSDYREIPYLHRYSNDRHYYMYVDSINGKPEDVTHLSFPNVEPPAGHSLFFDYYLQQGAGKLQIEIETAKGKELVFEEVSVAPSSAWLSGCVRVTNEDTDIEFIATHGYGMGQYIGLTNVGFLGKECQDRNISCGFTEGTCQYGNLNYYSKWERINSRNDTDLTDGFYMKTTLFYYSESNLASPTENITNSCVQIRYKIINKNCKLTIYNAFNNNTILSMVSDDTTPWGIAQVYIQQEITKLVFQAQSVSYGVCGVLLDYVYIRENNCPQLDCPVGTRKCKNNYCYSESKVCDRTNDCSDGSDEMNCPDSISCDFATKYYCGYKIAYGWVPVLDNGTSFFNVPGSMQIIGTKGKMLSPMETLADSCVNIKFTTAFALTGNFSVILHQKNPNGNNSHHLAWNEYFFSQRDETYEGQFQLPAGTSFLTFIADIKTGGMAINSVNIYNGTCPELNCPKYSHKCLDNSKCINEKNLCNNYENCITGSDEANCPKYFSCDFEDTNMCGCKSHPENAWGISTGMFGNIPSIDNSEGTYEGQYIMSNYSKESKFTVPQIEIEETFCFNFHYMFYGNGTVSVYDNDTYLMSLSKFDYDMWRGVNITLSGGIHNIHFAYSKEGNSTSGAIALDSVSIIPGRCLYKRCEENWYPCNNNATCYSFSEKCDGMDHCPNGEDEYNCSGVKREFKLTHGRTLMSGRVEKLYGSDYIPVCKSYLSDDIVNDICSELGANGTTTQTSIKTYMTGNYYYYYYYYNYYGYQRWDLYNCDGRCQCDTTYVTCSNTSCENGEVRCPPGRNETNSTNVCIRKESMCNGEIDCEGGTDEKNCASCAIGNWQCKNLKCIKQELRCDGKKDCDDDSDEFYCFTYINNTILVSHNGSYENICEDNLNSEKIANHLCSSVGRSNGTFGNSIEGFGVKFTQNPSDSNMGLIPGFKANSFEKCKYMVLECSKEVCGTRKRDLFEPIVQNGHNALQGEWPWVVELLRGTRFVCTASLISRYYVLTAAHCVENNYYGYSVRTGSIKRGEGKLYKVTQVLIHDEYGHFIKGYDLALLYIESGIILTDDVQPICLPEKPASIDKVYYVTGWGRNEKDESVYTLQEIKNEIVEYQNCRKYFSAITKAVICGNNKEFYSPICFGDSGGPFQTQNDHGQWEVQGVSSFVAKDCRYTVSYPAGFSAVYSGIEWIKKYVHV